MEMENSKRPFLRWLSAQFRHAAKRVGEGRNAVTFFQNRLMKTIRSRFQPPVSAIEGKKKLTWVSLKGRLVGAEEATSSAAIKGHLGLEEAAAWELFSPLERVLIVAVVAVAALDLNKRSQMAKLRRQLESKAGSPGFSSHLFP